MESKPTNGHLILGVIVDIRLTIDIMLFLPFYVCTNLVFIACVADIDCYGDCCIINTVTMRAMFRLPSMAGSFDLVLRNHLGL